MSLKQHLICELKALQRSIKAAPGDLKIVMRAGRIVNTLREQWRISDAEMKRILMSSEELPARESRLAAPRRELRASPRAAS